MEGNDEGESDAAHAEDDVKAALTARMMNSLVISPSKSVARSSQALSPIRKPSVNTTHGEFIGQRESQESYGQGGNVGGSLYVRNLNETQDLHIHSAAVVKSSEVSHLLCSY